MVKKIKKLKASSSNMIKVKSEKAKNNKTNFQKSLNVKNNQRSWALVTGASAGIGKEVALRLAGEGYGLILLARRQNRLQELSAEIQKKYFVPVEIAAVDLTDSKALSSYFNKNKKILEKVEVLINNAGLALGVDKIQDGNPEDWDTMLATNVQGLLKVTRAILPGLVSRQRGHVINIGSVAGRWVYAGGAVYCATKFAVRALTEGLRMDLLGTGVRVTNIEPGMVETEFTLVRLRSHEKSKKYYEGMMPLRPQDIAESIVWCLRQPQHVNIQELVIFPTDQAAVGPGYTYKR